MRLTTCFLPTLAVVAALTALTGCAPTLPVLVEPIGCPVDAAVLARRCTPPRPIADGSTYGEVLALHQLDRQALRDCAAHDQALADMIGACQRAIEAYNAKLADINRRNAERP